MKPADQLKVIMLSFFSIVVIIGVITLVSIMTTNAVASHGAGGHGAAAEHGTAATDHGAPAADHGAKTEEHAAPAAHDEKAKTEEHAAPAAHDEKAKTEEHAAPAAHDEKPKAETKAAVGGNAEAGAKVFAAKTCTTCHAVSKVPGAVGAIGPKLDGLGERAAKTVSGQDAITYIKTSIENPNAHVAEGYPAAMPALRTTMNDTEFNDLVAFLASL